MFVLVCKFRSYKELVQSIEDKRTFFTSLDAFHPRVIKIWVADIATILKPRATVSTASTLARFLDDAALGAHLTECLCHARRRGLWFGQVDRVIFRSELLQRGKC